MTVTDASPALPAEAAPLPEIEVAPPPIKPARLVSLDIFRGVTIAAMLLVNNPGIGNAYAPLKHADWHGWTPTDLIFPFFLFIVGVAVPFSLARRSADASSTRLSLLAGIWSRALVLILLGLLLTGIPYVNIDRLPEGYTTLKVLRIVTYVFSWGGVIALLVPWRSKRIARFLPIAVAAVFALLLLAIHHANRSALAAGIGESFSFGNGMFTPYKLRFPGVLQRIGICYGVAASIALFAGWRTVLMSAVLLMAGYSALMLRMPYPDHVTGSLSRQDNLARHVDVDVFRNHVYPAYPDPEGLVSTLPAIASVLLGIWVGIRLRATDRTQAEKCAWMLAMGVVVTILGVLLDWWLMPINKQIWTPSFTVFTAGLGMLSLGLCFYLADLRGRRRWALPFVIYGMNAIAAFVLAGLLVRGATLIRLDDPRNDNPEAKITLLTAWKQQVTQGVHQFADWLQQASPYAPDIATPGMTSLAYSLSFVLVVLLFMSVLYVFKIFVKV